MPNINLRLTEEEHAELRQWAKDGRRSLQKEIIFRLFSGLTEGPEAEIGTHAPSPRPTGSAQRPGAPAELPAERSPSVSLGPAPLEPGVKKRMHPCRHHVPPSKVCQYCDA